MSRIYTQYFTVPPSYRFDYTFFKLNILYGKDNNLYFNSSVWLYSYGIICNTEEGRVWIENKLYRGEDYYKLKRAEEERIKTIVEDSAIALLAKDVERLSELSYYKDS
ncbi:MAG: hypothetical protein J7K17_05770 [Candidatus Omnitrophica bacterium]|nr:hypothetical protein [Candidatus Omnitrophota bacterium]